MTFASRVIIHNMPAASIRRHAPGGSAGSEPRPPSQASHLALVTASQPVEDGDRLARNPQQAFGARLKSARERRGITLKAVADATKVTTSCFEALERGDVSRWPKGLYKRAFFRSYIGTIGLPADSTVDEFLRLFPDEYTTVAEAVPPPAEPAAGTEPATLRLTLAPESRRAALLHAIPRHALLDGVTVLVIALALVWWTSLDVSTGAAVVALCYYPQLARRLRRHVTSWSITSSGRRSPHHQPETAVPVTDTP